MAVANAAMAAALNWSAVVYLDVECGRLATSAKSKVRYREQPGKHMLVPSFTHFDPEPTFMAGLIAGCRMSSVAGD
jgi:hypothetical protein